jgi:hypothetical protein
VRKRLDAIESGQTTIMNTIDLGPLPSLRRASLQATVRDESEIGDALSDLLPRLSDELGERGMSDVEIVLTYDGTEDEKAIVVTTGIPVVGDAIDASGLETSGIYRQILTPTGGVMLQAPVTDKPAHAERMSITFGAEGA